LIEDRWWLREFVGGTGIDVLFAPLPATLRVSVLILVGWVARTETVLLGTAPRRTDTTGSAVFSRLRWAGVAGSTTEFLRSAALGVKLISVVERRLRGGRRAAI
jgi:hypothetical protein